MPILDATRTISLSRIHARAPEWQIEEAHKPQKCCVRTMPKMHEAICLSHWVTASEFRRLRAAFFISQIIRQSVIWNVTVNQAWRSRTTTGETADSSFWWSRGDKEEGTEEKLWAWFWRPHEMPAQFFHNLIITASGGAAGKQMVYLSRSIFLIGSSTNSVVCRLLLYQKACLCLERSRSTFFGRLVRKNKSLTSYVRLIGMPGSWPDHYIQGTARGNYFQLDMQFVACMFKNTHGSNQLNIWFTAPQN